MRRRIADASSRLDARPHTARRGVGDQAGFRDAATRARRERDVEVEVLCVERHDGSLRRHRLREREALHAEEIRSVRPVRDDASVAGAARVGTHVDVGAGGGHRRRPRTRQQDSAPAETDGGGRLRGVHLRAVVEVRADAGFPAGAVAVDDALLRHGRRAVPGHRAGVAAVEDPAPESDDAIPAARPRPGRIHARLPLEVDEPVVVPGREPVGVLRIEEHEVVHVGTQVSRREVAARVAVHPLDDAVHQHRGGVDRLAAHDRGPLRVDEDEHVENRGVDARRIAAAAERGGREVAVHRRPERGERREHGDRECHLGDLRHLPGHRRSFRQEHLPNSSEARPSTKKTYA